MRKNEYSVPKPVYYQCLWLIKDIDRLRKLEAVSNYAAKDDELVFFMDDEEVIEAKAQEAQRAADAAQQEVKQEVKAADSAQK